MQSYKGCPPEIRSESETCDKAVVKKNGATLEMSLSGISYTDFFPNSSLGLRALAGIIGSFMALDNCKDFFLIELQTNDLSLFVAQVEYHIDRRFYQLSRQHQVWFPTRLIQNLVSISKSSLRTRVSLIEQDSSTDTTPLVQVFLNDVLVDASTRKSTPFSKQFREKYATYIDAEEKTEHLVVPRKAPPQNAFSSSFQIRHSDTDYNQHLNYSVYITLSFNCANDALAGEVDLRVGNTDVCLREVELCKCCFLQECHVGDWVQVFVWADESVSDTLQFLIKKDNKNMFYSVMKFYPIIPSARL